MESERHSSADLKASTERLHKLQAVSEDLIGATSEAGIETKDSPFIRHVTAAAAAIGTRFDQALAAAEITQADLFDEAYRPIEGSNPPQVLTRFTEFTDRILPTIQEPLLDADPRVVFCAAVDRNGYLPTHNRKFSRPQSSDVVWNTANCRNRRVFDDRVGLAAGRNRRPVLIQVYRRDMGGGQFAMMKDLSVPIMVSGRHWGSLRMGYKVD